MPSRISIQLNDITRDLLEAEAGQRKISLSGLLREIAAEAAKEFRRPSGQFVAADAQP